MKNLNMVQGKPMKLLFFFALPLMFGNVFQQLYTVVDTAIVGRGVGMEALAALGTVDWLNWMMLGIAQGFTQGFAVRIAQKYGEGDSAGLKHVVAQSAFLSIVIALIITIVGLLCLPVFLTVMRVPEELTTMAQLYTRILMGGFSAVTFYNYCSSVLRAVGDSKTPLMAMILASFINIALDCVTVFGLGWGIAGAAAATVFAQCFAGIICAVKIWRTPELRFGKNELRPEGVLIGNLIRLGTPVAAKNIVIALGGMLVQTVVNGFEISFIAGFVATNKLCGLLEIAAISYGYAITTYVGQNYGARKLDRIKIGVRSAVVISVITSVVIAAVVILFGRQITMLFIASDVPELAAAAGDTAYLFLCIMCVSLPVLYLLHIHLSALQGMGKTVDTMISGMIELLMRVTISIIIGFTGYQNGIFMAETMAWYGAASFLMLQYYRYIKKLLATHAEQ